MEYKLKDLIDINLLQILQDKLNEISPFPSSLVDREGEVLTATGHQDICKKFHQKNAECAKECIKSDKYIYDHLNEANPAIVYKCPHGLIDCATPIIIDGNHLGNFFSGQLFLEEPDQEFFTKQAAKYGFDEREYLKAVAKVPIWTKEKLDKNIDFIRSLVEILGKTGYNSKKELETRKILEENQRELIKTKEKAESSHRQFRDFFENAADAIFIAETDTGTILAANNSAAALMMLPANEIIGMHQSMIHPQTDNSYYEFLFREHVREIDEMRLTNSSESIILRSDGTEIPVEVRSASVLFEGKRCMMGTFRDITSRKRREKERKKLEEKVLHSQRLMQYIIEHSRSAIAVHDKDLKYVYVSQRYLEDYKIKEHNIIGRYYYDVMTDLPQRWKDIHKQALEGKIYFSDNDQYTSRDGHTEWIRWECRPWYESDGTTGGIIVSTEVITKQKEAELEIIQAKEMAEQNDQLKTAFLRNMSHEIRTPLNSIVGFSQLITESAPADDKIRVFSDILISSSQKLTDIISDMVESARIQTNQIETQFTKFEIFSLIREIVSDFMHKANEKNLRLILKQDNRFKEYTAFSDIEKLKKILFHLIDNAIKFTESGSVEITTKIESGDLQISIVDTGIGIDAEDQKVIFEPFRQLENDLCRKYEGNGLGLSITKAYIEALNGEITLNSRLGKGTNVYISLPADAQNYIQKADEPSPAKLPETETLSNIILIVEDEYLNYMFLEEALQSNRTRILHASNGLEAIDHCKNNDGINLILMDMRMPVMDGITAAKKIKAFRPDLPIISQTAYAIEKKDVSDDLFNDHIIKPINRKELENKVRRFISL